MVFTLIVNTIAAGLFIALKISLDIINFSLFGISWALRFLQSLVFNAAQELDKKSEKHKKRRRIRKITVEAVNDLVNDELD